MKRIISLFVVAIFVAALPELAAAGGPKGAKSTKVAKTSNVAKPTKVTKPTKAAQPTKVAKAPKVTKTAKASATTTTTTTSTTTSTTTPRALPKNAKLVERLQKMLPDGTDMNDAASKFRNQGQFVAAVHASNKLDVPFEDLKSYMVDDGMSLGQAIKKLRPSVDAEQAAAAATTQANTDLGTTQAKSKRR